MRTLKNQHRRHEKSPNPKLSKSGQKVAKKWPKSDLLAAIHVHLSEQCYKDWNKELQQGMQDYLFRAVERVWVEEGRGSVDVH
jgi:hypothetical protein